jgi:hypothetical protein
MPDFHYGSYCGLYCGACDVMHQFKNGLRTGSPPRWEDLPPTLQNNLPVPDDSPIVCYGCKSDVVFHGCGKCPIRKCARGKDNIENCTECNRYPCIRFRIIKLVWRLGGFYRKLPHLRTVNSNLKEIRKSGVTRWLEHQKQEWHCSLCHVDHTWYTKDSHECQKQRQPDISQNTRLGETR